MNMKRTMMILLALMLSLSLLAGCGADEPAPAPEPDTETEVDEDATEETALEDVEIDLVVGFGAGGSNDVAARYMGEALRQHGIIVNVVNIAGGMGTEAAYHVANQPPDANMFFWSQAMTMIFEPAIDDRGFTIDDFVPVGMLASPTFCLGSRAEAPWETFDDLVQYIRDNPGEVTVGGQGEGSMMHFYTTLMLDPEELDYIYVPFAGGADVSLNLTGGHVDLGHLSLAASRPLHEAGDMTVLVNTQVLMDRDPLMPDIPNITEFGIAAAEPHSISVFAVPGTDEALIQRITEAMEAVAQDETLIENYRNSGLIAHYLNPEETLAFYMEIHEEIVPAFQEWSRALE